MIHPQGRNRRWWSPRCLNLRRRHRISVASAFALKESRLDVLAPRELLKTNVIASVLLVLIVSAASVAGEADTRPESTDGLRDASSTELGTVALDLAAIALKDFKRQNKLWRCFRALIYHSDGDWRVDFLATDNVQDLGDSVVVNTSKCGLGISYIVNAKGEIVRRIYSR